MIDLSYVFFIHKFEVPFFIYVFLCNGLNLYYSLWKIDRFDKPTLYDYTFTVRFPNVVFRAKNLQEANKKIEEINRKIKEKDIFDLNQSKILKLAS